ncbi:MAG: glycosyl transferase family 2 [Crocinitomicaceae bacterium]|nr:glycosyl transferase family 2 [Crocinitomicaceae bacterium]
MKLSVIIVSYNVEGFLTQCLVSVERAIAQAKALGSGDVEVFVVDNNSVDGTCKIVKDKFPWVKLIENKDNTGFSVANNQAIVLSKGEYVLLLNPDTVVSEDTFISCIEYSDKHPNLGGLGVPMYDGRGTYLPESKRGIPTPFASLSRMSGMYKLAPKSEKLNSYYAGHISKDENAEIEILSGAFMWMRASAIDKVGMLDETFFMYGEDIDLSWRIIKGGYENHYFAETQIIHYKGESTKKGSLNYVSVFYKAMLIFAAKHFEGGQAWIYNMVIRLAIYARATLSIVRRIAEKLLLPSAEWLALFGSLLLILKYYSEYSGIDYNWDLATISLGSYSSVFIVVLWLFGGYDRPWVPRRVMKGIAAGTIILIAVYGLLPESIRFSRAILLLGAISFFFIVAIGRIIFGQWRLGKRVSNRLLVASPAEADSICSLLNTLEPQSKSPQHKTSILDPSNVTSLSEFTRIHNIGEVIFSGRDVTANAIISSLASISSLQIVCRIAWTDDGSVMGSGGPGPDPVTELDGAIYSPSARRSKRLLDIALSLLLIVLSPLLFISARFKWVKNAFSVLLGFKTWVGINIPGINQEAFSKPFVILAVDSDDIRVRERLSLSYARQYHPFEDLKLVLNSLLLQNENR